MMHTRLAELLGRLSLACDIANDSPWGKAVRSVVLAVELGKHAGASSEELRDTYWLSLFAYLGFAGFTHEAGALGVAGDRGARSAISLLGVADPVAGALGLLPGIALEDRTVAEHCQHAMCEASLRFAEIVSAGGRTPSALSELCARWDGGGPASLEALALPIRLQQVGHVLETVHARRGREGAVAFAGQRAGSELDPRLSKVFLDNQAALFTAIEDPEIFKRFLGLEPDPVTLADEGRIEDVVRALTIFAELKCPTFLGHSSGVARLAERAAVYLSLSADDTRALRFAALLHDIGRLGVSNEVWTRPGPLNWAEWEQVRLHSYYTERVLSPIGALSTATDIAVAAHERADGSGYHQRRTGRSLSLAARLLAAADVAFAMSEARPHRPALEANAIARELMADVCSGQLDATAVEAVLAAMGVQTLATPPALHGLSAREVDVSRLLCRGKTNKEIAELLGISPRTVQNHVAHIFDKLGVYSRSGAAIWLMEHDLVLH